MILGDYISDLPDPHQPDVLEMFDELFINVPLASHFYYRLQTVDFLMSSGEQTLFIHALHSKRQISSWQKATNNTFTISNRPIAT